MDTLGPLFQPLLTGAHAIARPVLGSYQHVVGPNQAPSNLVIALCFALAGRSAVRVHSWASANAAGSRGHGKGKGKDKEDQSGVNGARSNGRLAFEDADLENEQDATHALATLHLAYVGVLLLAATRSPALSGGQGDEARSLALVVAVLSAVHQALMWLLSDEPAPVALAATNHCLAFILALFPLGGASRHLKAAQQDPHTLLVGRALVGLSGFLIVVALTAVGLSLGRWAQFRRLEMQLAAAILLAHLVALTLIEFV